MANYKVGDKVRATQDINSPMTGVFVNKGHEGVITKLNHWGDPARVKFNEGELDVNKDQVI